jgi:hypothetical protein
VSEQRTREQAPRVNDRTNYRLFETESTSIEANNSRSQNTCRSPSRSLNTWHPQIARHRGKSGLSGIVTLNTLNNNNIINKGPISEENNKTISIIAL